jgi:hypothetical protein
VHLAHILDLIFEDNRLNVYAGEREVRPPGAPTIGRQRRLSGRPVNTRHSGASVSLDGGATNT